jgi:hypothetical protein
LHGICRPMYPVLGWLISWLVLLLVVVVLLLRTFGHRWTRTPGYMLGARRPCFLLAVSTMPPVCAAPTHGRSRGGARSSAGTRGGAMPTIVPRVCLRGGGPLLRHVPLLLAQWSHTAVSAVIW